MTRVMTVAEVNAILPELDAILGRLIEIRREIAARANEIERLGFDPAGPRSRDLPPSIAERKDLLEAAVAAFEREIDRIAALGGIVHDLDLGSVDFHHRL